MKTPLNYNCDDVDKIKNKLINIGIGERGSNEANNVDEGRIIDYTRAPNRLDLPAKVIFKSNSGKMSKLDFYQIKWIREIS